MIETLTVRVGTPADLSALDVLFARSYPKLLKAAYPPSVLVTALPLISKAQPRLLASGTFFVAEMEGGVVGAGGWSRTGTAGTGEIRHVVTDAQHQRCGIGAALFERIFETARAAGMRRMVCKATRNAVPFYQAMGFAGSDEIGVPLGPGIVFPAVAMARAL